MVVVVVEAVAVCVFVTTIVVLKVSVAVACGTSVSLSVIVVVVTETTVLPGIVVEMVSAVCVTVEVGATLIVVVHWTAVGNCPSTARTPNRGAGLAMYLLTMLPSRFLA